MLRPLPIDLLTRASLATGTDELPWHTAKPPPRSTR
jgi:hypothetical protein